MAVQAQTRIRAYLEDFKDAGNPDDLRWIRFAARTDKQLSDIARAVLGTSGSREDLRQWYKDRRMLVANVGKVVVVQSEWGIYPIRGAKQSGPPKVFFDRGWDDPRAQAVGASLCVPVDSPVGVRCVGGGGILEKGPHVTYPTGYLSIAHIGMAVELEALYPDGEPPFLAVAGVNPRGSNYQLSVHAELPEILRSRPKPEPEPRPELSLIMGTASVGAQTEQAA
jgi:hypothetical protein